uniref:C2H2-type domain-containing protein n=1 Tax=Kalanchoe fedtschenkoi TaxID=63787 RepID=A0A7N0UJP3_KALFE
MSPDSSMNERARQLCDRGRSLGGHMRSRVAEAEDAAREAVKLASLCDYSDDEDEEEVEEDEQVDDEQVDEDDKDSMVEEAKEKELRPNSKKRDKRAEDSSSGKKFVCVKCGKGFQSQKAMCGHMACHSEKDKSLSTLAAHKSSSKSSWFNPKLVMDSHSDTETGVAAAAAAGPALRRRSKRVKYKSSNGAGGPSAGHNAGPKPNFSVPNYNGGSSVSVVENEQEEVAKCLMMLSRDSGKWGGLNSVGDSSDLSVKMEDRPGFKVVSGGRIGVRLKRGLDELAKELRSNDSCNLGAWNNSVQKIDSACTNVVSSRTCAYNEGDKFECLVCHKVFATHPALVKHAGKHSRRSAESDAHSVETNMSPPTPDLRKGKGKMDKSCGSKRVKHECPVCLKAFRSGQALGGHKRIHLTSGGLDELRPINEQVPLQDSSSQAHSCIDLNQPAPLEDHEFLPW